MLALIAGEGALPGEIVRAQGSAPLVCALDGFAPDGLTVTHRFRLETLGTLLGDLRAAGVREVCLAGAIRRPEIDPGAVDAATVPLVPALRSALQQGDDAALRAVIGLFESAGFDVRAAADLAPDLVPPAGVAGAVTPSDGARADAVRADAILRAMSVADIGQGCAVLNGQALAVEGVFGTDWMLDSLQDRPDGGGGILFKAPKDGQDRRADLPAIGPGTADAAARAGLDGIVIAAGGVMVLDRSETIRRCDAHGLFLWVRERGG